jgi:hypothetical protein
MIMFIIAGRFLARYDYTKMLIVSRKSLDRPYIMKTLNILTKWLLPFSIMVTSVCSEDVDCTDNAQQIFGGKMKSSLLFTTDWSGRLLFLLSISCRRCCLCDVLEPTKKDPPSRACFYRLQSLFLSGYYSLLWRGKCYLSVASSRHGPWPSFRLNKFFILSINLTAIAIHKFLQIRYATFPQIRYVAFQICYADLA